MWVWASARRERRSASRPGAARGASSPWPLSAAGAVSVSAGARGPTWRRGAGPQGAPASSRGRCSSEVLAWGQQLLPKAASPARAKPAAGRSARRRASASAASLLLGRLGVPARPLAGSLCPVGRSAPIGSEARLPADSREPDLVPLSAEAWPQGAAPAARRPGRQRLRSTGHIPRKRPRQAGGRPACLRLGSCGAPAWAKRAGSQRGARQAETQGPGTPSYTGRTGPPCRPCHPGSRTLRRNPGTSTSSSVRLPNTLRS